MGARVSAPDSVAGAPRGPSARWSPLELGVAVVAVAGVLLALLPALELVRPLRHVGMQEDAMIGLRHLRNLLDGEGLVYNRGQSALGVTDPLFWLASGVLAKPLLLLGLSPDVITAHYVACLVFLATALLLFAFAGRAADRLVAPAVLGLLGAAFFWPLRFLYLGLEGPFLLLSVALVGFLAGRWRGRREATLAGLVGALSWNRPEIALLAAVCVLPHLALLRDRSLRARSAAAWVAGFAAMPVLFRLLSGSFLPGTVEAKAYFGNPSAPPTLAFLAGRLEYLDAFLATGKGTAAALLAVAFVAAVLGPLAYLRGPRERVPWATSVFPAFVLGYGGFVLFVPALWEWYVTFWVAFSLVLVGVLLSLAARGVAGERPRRLLALGGAALLLLGAGGWFAGRLEARRAEIIGWLEVENGFRGHLSRELGTRWAAKSVWMEAAGWQGYFHDARVYDEVGLVDDSTLPLARQHGCRYFVSALQTLRPEFVIKRRFEIERNVLITPPKSCPNAPLFVDEADRAWFDAHYARVERYQTPIAGYFGEYSFLDLYRRTSDD